jgi:hypothetical protein
MKQNIFKEEFAWLAQYLPEALGQDTGEGNSQNNFQDTLQTIIREIEITREDGIANTIDFINFPNESSWRTFTTRAQIPYPYSISVSATTHSHNHPKIRILSLHF